MNTTKAPKKTRRSNIRDIVDDALWTEMEYLQRDKIARAWWKTSYTSRQVQEFIFAGFVEPFTIPTAIA